jgi:hypothetical protein
VILFKEGVSVRTASLGMNVQIKKEMYLGKVKLVHSRIKTSTTSIKPETAGSPEIQSVLRQ